MHAGIHEPHCSRHQDARQGWKGADVNAGTERLGSSAFSRTRVTRTKYVTDLCFMRTKTPPRLFPFSFSEEQPGAFSSTKQCMAPCSAKQSCRLNLLNSSRAGAQPRSSRPRKGKLREYHGAGRPPSRCRRRSTGLSELHAESSESSPGMFQLRAGIRGTPSLTYSDIK